MTRFDPTQLNLEYIYENVDDLCEVSDLRWLGINVLDDENEANMASDLDNSRRRYIRSLVHEVYVAQLIPERCVVGYTFRK